MPDNEKSKAAYGPVMLFAGLIGIALFCVAHALYTFPTRLGEVEPTWALTPLYMLPVAIGLMIAGRIGFAGLIFLTLAVTGAHYLAQTLGIMTMSVLPDDKSNELVTFSFIGAVAGAIGSATSFIAFALLGRDLRDKAHLIFYGQAIVGLAITGALGFLSLMLINNGSNKWIVNLYLPWQLAFTFAIARIFHRRSKA